MESKPQVTKPRSAVADFLLMSTATVVGGLVLFALTRRRDGQLEPAGPSAYDGTR